MQSKGIEPLSDEWKSPILPLNHDCKQHNVFLHCITSKESLLSPVMKTKQECYFLFDSSLDYVCIVMSLSLFLGFLYGLLYYLLWFWF